MSSPRPFIFSALVFLAVVLEPSFPCFRLQAATPSDFLFGSLPKTGSEIADLPYRLLLPPNYDANVQYPMIVFLHGSGERGNDNISQVNHNAGNVLQFVSADNQAAYPCFMLIPQANTTDGWNGNTLGQVVRAIRQLSATYSIDHNRIYLTGLSLGGAGTWTAINRFPSVFAAAAPMAGWGPGNYERNAGIPIWCFHAADDPVVTVLGSDSAVAGTRQAGGQVIYTRYTTGGHNIWGTAYGNPYLLPWLMAQRRNQPMRGDLLIEITDPSDRFVPASVLPTRDASGTATLPGGVAQVNWSFVSFASLPGFNLATYPLASGTSPWSVRGAPVAVDSALFLVVASGSTWASGTGSDTGGGTTTVNASFWNIPLNANLSAPSLQIQIPQPSGTVVSNPNLTLAGTASAANGKSVKMITWTNNRGGQGVAVGTSTWSADAIDLAPGDNIITATARDSAGITAQASITVTLQSGGDTEPPSAPTPLTGTATSASTTRISWGASTDNVGVTGYRIYRDGLLIATSGNTFFDDTGLDVYSTYTYTVTATDAAGNVSAPSPTLILSLAGYPSGSSSSSSSSSGATPPTNPAPKSGGGANPLAFTPSLLLLAWLRRVHRSLLRQ